MLTQTQTGSAQEEAMLLEQGMIHVRGFKTNVPFERVSIGKDLIMTRHRFPGFDLFAPHGVEQYKFTYTGPHFCALLHCLTLACALQNSNVERLPPCLQKT